MATIDRVGSRIYISAAASANGNLNFGVDAGTLVDIKGVNGIIYLALQKTGTGTCSVTPQSSFDQGTVFYSIGYYLTDATNVLSRTTGAISVLTGTFNHTYQIIDPAPQIQVVVSASSGSFSLTGYLYLTPV